MKVVYSFIIYYFNNNHKNYGVIKFLYINFYYI